LAVVVGSKTVLTSLTSSYARIYIYIYGCAKEHNVKKPLADGAAKRRAQIAKARERGMGKNGLCDPHF